MAAKLLRSFRYLFKKNLRLSGVTGMTDIAEKHTDAVGESALDKLKDFGYAFNDSGQLRKLDADGNLTEQSFVFEKTNDYMKNQLHYEQLGEHIPDVVYELLEQEGLTRTYFPADVPKEEATFVFTKPAPLHESKKLLILIHGSGAVRAGQWARSLIINYSIDHGTMIPYIKRGIELGYDILVMNPNDNTRIIDGKQTFIKDSHMPVEHAITAWKSYVMNTNPESIAIVAHSYGGVIVMELAKRFSQFFKEKVFAVALTDSVHNDSALKADMREFMSEIACNWRASKKPLDDVIESHHDLLKQLSAGHEKHEWTSYSAFDSVFKFLEERYEHFNHTQQIMDPEEKRAKLDEE